MSPSTRYVMPRVVLGVAWLLLTVAALAVGGVGVMLIAMSLPVLAVAAFAAVVGHARFAFIPDRGNAVAVAAIAFALILIAGTIMPEPSPSSLAAGPSPTRSAPTTTSAEIAAATAPPLTTATSVSVPTTTTTTKATKTTSANPRSTTTRAPATTAAATPLSTKAGCDPAYPSMCLALTGPDLDCHQIPQRRFPVRAPDRHKFDPDNDGIGCE